jgi:1-pyrroline-5-carboxylate dehydrogenase
MSTDKAFKLTYATMFNPPEMLHSRFSEAVNKRKSNLGKEHGMIIDGKEVFATTKFEDRTPIDTTQVLGIFQNGTAEHANAALAAARKALQGWKTTPWQKRVEFVRKAADLMEDRIFDIAAIMSMEVGKNRMESLGDVAESIELMRYACDQMEANNGYMVTMKPDPLVGMTSTNVSHMKPYGVWLVISPFNFPGALTTGPVGSALVTGNTVVFKPATDTPWVPRMLAECLRDAGIPEGVYNYVTGPGSTLGQALIDNPEVDGITFTGSFDVGMKIYRDFAKGKWVRPIILELGGKNPAIVSKNANLDDAALGIMRSAFGLQGQKCSACSRVFAEEPIYDTLLEKLGIATNQIKIGDPLEKDILLGPVINKNSYQDFQNYCEDAKKGGGKFLTGGNILTEGILAKGYFCAPTIITDLPEVHRLWKQEMFVPIVTITPIKNLEEGMQRANDVAYGLCAGFYGSTEEADWFFENIEAGVTYANRPQGATTGAWPGYQPFGGWKGSGATGKNAGGVYYLPMYMREQIHTHVKK